MKGDIIVRLVVLPNQKYSDAESWAWIWGTKVGPIGKDRAPSEAVSKMLIQYLDWLRTGKEIVWTEMSSSAESFPPSPPTTTTTAPGTRDTKSEDPQVLEQLLAQP